MRDASSLGQVRSCGRSCKLGSLVLDAVHQSFGDARAQRESAMMLTIPARRC